jgi:protein ImuA
MNACNVIDTLEAAHPALWRASQLASNAADCLDTGYAVLSQQLPGGGWPLGVMTELLLPQHGGGELRLLRPALEGLAPRSIVLVQPPHEPQSLALAAQGIDPARLLWIRGGDKTGARSRNAHNGDVLWAAEQVLRSGCCGALLLWQNHVRSETLRRLHLAAQSSNTLFVMMRPLAAAQDASPAPLRLSVTPAPGGIEIGFVKRKGPLRDAPLFLPLTPSLLQRHALVDRPASVPAPARSVLPALVG